MEELAPHPSPDELLDAAIEFTFPASDPISIDSAFRAAEKRAAGGQGKGSE